MKCSDDEKKLKKKTNGTAALPVLCREEWWYENVRGFALDLGGGEGEMRKKSHLNRETVLAKRSKNIYSVGVHRYIIYAYLTEASKRFVIILYSRAALHRVITRRTRGSCRRIVWKHRRGNVVRARIKSMHPQLRVLRFQCKHNRGYRYRYSLPSIVYVRYLPHLPRRYRCTVYRAVGHSK